MSRDARHASLAGSHPISVLMPVASARHGSFARRILGDRRAATGEPNPPGHTAFTRARAKPLEPVEPGREARLLFNEVERIVFSALG